jgi:hypothetical protein
MSSFTERVTKLLFNKSSVFSANNFVTGEARRFGVFAEFNKSERIQRQLLEPAEQAEKSELRNALSVLPPPLRISALRSGVTTRLYLRDDLEPRGSEVRILGDDEFPAEIRLFLALACPRFNRLNPPRGA